MLDVERTLLALHGDALGTHGALRQVRLGDVRHPLEVVVTGVAEMGRTCVTTTILLGDFSSYWKELNQEEQSVGLAKI
jgi:hypothetical protein